jgi:LPS sulfotransferase NodH
MYNHIRKNKLGYLFEQKDLKFIHLVRENVLKKYISSEVARVRKIAHSDQKLPQIGVKININQALKSMQQYIEDVNHFQSILADKDAIEVSYEEFFKDPENEIIPILNFLGTPQKKLYCKSQKLTQNDLSQVVENYEDLFDNLKGTQFEKFLYM